MLRVAMLSIFFSVIMNILTWLLILGDADEDTIKVSAVASGILIFIGAIMAIFRL